MPILDLTEKTARGSGQLNKFSVKANGRDEAAFVYDMQVVFVVSNSAEAEVVERLIPGAKGAYQRATERDDWKMQQTVVPDIQGARMVLADAADNVVAIQGGVEIKGVLLRASKRAVTLTVKAQCAGQTEQVATALTKLLRNPVELVVESTQQQLAFRKGPMVAMGAVVVAKDDDGAVVFGRVHDIDHEAGLVLLDLFGATEFAVRIDSITTAWALVPGDATEKALRDFKAACKKAKVAPNFRAITVAVGEAYASEPPADGQHRLTAEVVARAVALIKEGAATTDESGAAPKTVRRAGGKAAGIDLSKENDKVVPMRHGLPAQA